jgi:hypothetical protein
LKLTLTNRDITTIDASTGGIEALQRLVAAFSRELPSDFCCRTDEQLVKLPPAASSVVVWKIATHYSAECRSWVKNGCGGRSTGTSAVPQIADDFGAPRKSAEVGQ